MARRRLLDDEQWAALFALPAGECDVVRHCTLTPDDLTLVAAKRSVSNRLGYALLLCALEPGERLPAPMGAFVARQLGIDPAILSTGSDRPQTRREQLAELMRHVAPLGWEHISLTGTTSGPLTPSPGPACSGYCANGRHCWPRRFWVHSHKPDAGSTFVS